MVHFAHDRIVHLGGAEAVLADLIRTHGDTDSKIFVMYSDKTYFEVDGKQYPIVTALPHWINNLFSQARHASLFSRLGNWLFDYRNLMPFYPLLCWILRMKIKKEFGQLTTDNGQLYISSFAAIKNIIPRTDNRQPTTVLYLHSPMQYIRENYEEYCNKLTGVKKWIFVIVSKYLKPRDQALRRYDQIIYNSHYTKSVAEKLYPHLVSFPSFLVTVSYPPLHPSIISAPVAQDHEIRDYFIYVGRVVKFIRELDKVIQMANILGFNLLILGDGPDMAELKTQAGPTITFLGNISDIQTKISLITHSRGLINLAKESCGIATIEAMLMGVPVFGYNAGGTAELVDDQSGFLVDSKDLDTLLERFEKFQTIPYKRNTIKNLTKKKLGLL